MGFSAVSMPLDSSLSTMPTQEGSLMPAYSAIAFRFLLPLATAVSIDSYFALSGKSAFIRNEASSAIQSSEMQLSSMIPR